jgi:hypothetical protein
MLDYEGTFHFSLGATIWAMMETRSAMRAQYHFRKSPDGLLSWDVRALVEKARCLVPKRVFLSSIKELDEPYWTDGNPQPLTCREIAGHVGFILDSDLTYPIILSRDGRVMDGMHRVCKALLEGRQDIEAVQFNDDPAPDYIGVHPDDLPYLD